MIKPSGDDSFELFDLRVEWEGDGPCGGKAKAGDHFELYGVFFQAEDGIRYNER